VANPAFNEPRFQDEQAAFDYVESVLWPNGPVCPHCGNAHPNRIRQLKGKTTRIGLRACYECKGHFTVRQGTIFESSHLPLHLWLQVMHLMCASKKGVSTNQVQRMLRCSMKTAWFLTHRIREAMRDGELYPMGGPSTPVEADETFFGRKEGSDIKQGDMAIRMRSSLWLSAEAARVLSTLRALRKKTSRRLFARTLSEKRTL